MENISFSPTMNPQHPATSVRMVAIAHSSDNSNVSTFVASNLILDPQYPAMEPSPREYSNRIFNHQFGVFLEDNNSPCARKLSKLELL